MKIVKQHSHFHGEAYLIVHHPKLYEELKAAITEIDVQALLMGSGEQPEKTGQRLDVRIFNQAFENKLKGKGWEKIQQSDNAESIDNTAKADVRIQPRKKQNKGGDDAAANRNRHVPFIKEKISIETQFGKSSPVSLDWLKNPMLLYSQGVINLGIEVLPTKHMQAQMSSGIAYFEGEVYNVMRQGRNSPPVPLLILGVEP